MPTLAVWGPGLAEPLIYNAYTSDVVIAAVEKAETPKATGQASPILPDPPLQTRPAAHQTASR